MKETTSDTRQRGDRLDSHNATFFEWFMGKDTPMLSGDAVKALIGPGTVVTELTSKQGFSAAQADFNHWREESGRDFCQICRVPALSVPWMRRVSWPIGEKSARIG